MAISVPLIVNEPAAVGELTAPLVKRLAVALLTTLYGALLANVVCLPLAQKIGERAAHAALDDELMLQALLLIKRGGHPLELEGLIAPAVRAQFSPNNEAEVEVPRP